MRNANILFAYPSRTSFSKVQTRRKVAQIDSNGLQINRISDFLVPFFPVHIGRQDSHQLHARRDLNIYLRTDEQARGRTRDFFPDARALSASIRLNYRRARLFTFVRARKGGFFARVAP